MGVKSHFATKGAVVGKGQSGRETNKGRCLEKARANKKRFIGLHVNL